MISSNIALTTDAEKIFRKTIEKFGKVDVLVNAAGTMNTDAITGEIEPSTWWNDFEVNVRGTYNMVHYFIGTTGGKGTVINLVSLGASFLMPGVSSYSASKLAVIKLGECLDLGMFTHLTLRSYTGVI